LKEAINRKALACKRQDCGLSHISGQLPALLTGVNIAGIELLLNAH
jgi:hypothetical protein